jgi:hypothetical protein
MLGKIICKDDNLIEKYKGLCLSAFGELAEFEINKKE